jgi:hypothetical protein
LAILAPTSSGEWVKNVMAITASHESNGKKRRMLGQLLRQMQSSVATETIRRSHLLASSSSEENETDDEEMGASSPASAAYGSERHRTAIFLSAQIERIMRRKTRQTNRTEEPKLDATDGSVWYARTQRHSRTLTFRG